MRRYSIRDVIVQDWLAKESRLFLDISSRLDSEDLFRYADNFSSYSRRLSSLLKFSDDEKLVVDPVVVESPSKDQGEDIDLLFVDRVEENLDDQALFHKAPNIHTEGFGDIFKKAIVILSGSGKNVYEGLLNLSKSLPSIFNVEGGTFQGVLVESKTYEEFSYEQVSRIISSVLFVYYSNDYLLDKNIFAKEIIRDIVEDKVSRDTVALFSKLYKKKVNEFNINLSKESKSRELLKDVFPSMSMNFSRSFTERNFELALPSFVELSDNLKAVGYDVSKLKFRIEKVDRYVLLSRMYPNEFAHMLNEENQFDENLASGLPRPVFDSGFRVRDDFAYLEKLSKVPKSLYNIFNYKERFFTNATISYINDNQRLFSKMSASKDGYLLYNNDENSRYNIDSIWEKILLYGEESLSSNYDISGIEQKYIDITGEDSEFAKKLEAFGVPDFASTTYKDYQKRFLCYKCYEANKDRGIEFYYSYTRGLDDSNSYDIGSNILYSDLLPIYINYCISRKNMVRVPLGISIVNRYYKLLGDSLLESETPNSFYTLLNLLEKNASDEKVLEVLNGVIPRRAAAFFMNHSYLSGYSFEECIEFARTREVYFIPAASEFWNRDIEKAETSREFKDALDLAAKVLYLLGEEYTKKYDSIINQISFEKINPYTREYFRKLVLDSGSYIGNLDFFLSRDLDDLRKIAPSSGKFTNAEMYFMFAGSKSMNDVFTTRQSISRSKNYSSIDFGSEEYDKLSSMITLVPDIRGRDSKLLMDFFDIGASDKEYDEKNLFILLGAASGIKEFPDFGSERFELFRMIKNEIARITQDIGDYYNDLYRGLFVKKEAIINLGGFGVLFSKSADELIEIFRVAPENQAVFREAFGYALRDKDNYFEYGLKMDFRIYGHKLLVYAFSELFKSFPEVAKFDHLQHQRKQNYVEDIYHKLNNWDSKFVMSIYNMNINYPVDLKLPSYVNIGKANINLHTENLTNAGKIIRFFSKDVKKALNTFSIKYCQNAGYPVSVFDIIPDPKLKATIIHDMGNILPSDYYAYDENLANYYMDNLNNDLKDLKYVGDSWNNIIAILNDEMKFQERGFVREFSSSYDVSKLAEIIKRYGSAELFKTMNVQSAKFGMQYIDTYKIPSDINSDSSGYKVLYSNLERIYLMGQEVSMPSWSGFSSTVNGLTLRFLPKDDPKGMFLGVITNCCQHPKSWAASCSYDGYLNPLACFAVFESRNNIIMQSYVWSDEKGNVCFDSIEGKASIDDMNSAKKLLVEFARSISGKCTVGSNKLGFNKSTDEIINPSKTNEIEEVKNLLFNYTPNRNNNFYRSDSIRQNIVM
jgi:hypothetical protein